MLRRAVIPGVIVALVIAAAFVMFTDTSGQRTVTAYFPRTVSIYEGSDVRVLGVSVGKIDEVEPEGTRVKVTMHYDEDVKIPSEAKAVIISPSIVGDRYVQLTPAYTEGETLADDAVLEEDRTAVPLELDQIYASIDELTVALGPTGANKDGALSDLLESTARNFSGQGARFQQTIRDFGTFSQTLADNKEELFDSTAELGEFVRTLADNDGTVRAFNRSLSDVSTLLAGEREELAASLANLGEALDQVGTFVEENRASLGRNIHGLSRVARVLAKQRKAIDEILVAGPLALNNLALTYNPDTGTLDTNANFGNLAHELQTNPGLLLCAITQATDEATSGRLCDLFSLLDGSQGKKRAAPFAALGGTTSGGRFDPTLNGLVTR
jgi:phospholipid/cholesterol/gamma-HCH transport system substrate-binding protein